MEQRDPVAGTVVWRDPASGELFETSVRGGACKLQWKADWAMRWYALDVDYEMSGKDLIDSVRLSGRICRILGSQPPEGFTYELFLDEQAQKISKSKGNGLSVEEWLRYAPPESLSQFMFNAPQRAKRLYFDVIPRAVDEYLANAARLAAQPPAERPPTRRGTSTAAACPITAAARYRSPCCSTWRRVVNADTPDILWGFIRRYIPDATPETMPFLDRLVDYAIAYYRDFVRPAKRYRQPTRHRTRGADRPGRHACAAWTPTADAEAIQNDGVRGRQAAPVPRTARLVRLPVPGAARPAGRSALRRLRRAVRHRRDHRADRGRAATPADAA